ncbi:MAG: hypothetical protein Q9M36_10670 [Sulfurovum sp.]|nr:hypothetical protein [Sulfurovum sp.]
MKKILFVTYGGGHMKIIEPITKKLLEEKDIEFKILALTSAYSFMLDKFSSAVVKKVSDYSFLFDDIIDEVMSLGLELLDDNYSSNSIISKEEIIYYIGLSFYDLIQRVGKEEAYRLYTHKKRQAFLPIETMKKILDYENIDIVISTTAPRFEEASFIAAHELNIDTIEILDLFGELYPLPKAKHIVCMNSLVSDSLKAKGFTDKKYYHFGQPAIEKTIENILQLDVTILKNKMDLKNNITLLYATQIPNIYNTDFSFHSFAGYNTINDNIFYMFQRLYDKYNINILLRLHPSESIADYEKWLNKYPFVKYINGVYNIEESIAVCDLLLNQASTVSVEAIAVKKDVFTFKYHLDKTFPLPAIMKKPFIFSDGFEELEKNLSIYLEDPKKIDKLNDFLPKNSVKNIIALIKEL